MKKKYLLFLFMMCFKLLETLILYLVLYLLVLVESKLIQMQIIILI